MAESQHSKNVRKKPSPQGESSKKTRGYFDRLLSGDIAKKKLGIGEYSRAAKNKAAKDSKAIEKDASASRAKRKVMDKVNTEQGKVNRAKARAEATKKNQSQIKAKETLNTKSNARDPKKAYSVAEAKRKGLSTYVGRDGKPKAAVTAEELKKSGHKTLRAYLNAKGKPAKKDKK